MKNIGFLICAIGNGHFTQAHTIFSILIKYGYKVPVMIGIGKHENKLWKNILLGTDHYHESAPISEECMNSYNNPISFFNIVQACFSQFRKNLEKIYSTL